MSLPRFDLIPLLGRTALLAGLSDRELESLAAVTLRKRFPEGTLLFSEGEPCSGLHIVITGQLRIFKTSASGREQVLALEGPGSSVAELPVFDGGTYPASVVAVIDSEIAFISRQLFRAFCLEHPEVALKVLAVVGSRFRHLVGIIEELSFTTIRQRLVAALMRIAESSGRASTQGIEILLPGSHQELANQLGTVRELISRNLMRLQAEGLIEVDARRIVILDLPGMAAVRDGND